MLYLPEENQVSPDAEHHGQHAVANESEVPPPPVLPLLPRCLTRTRLMKLLPVITVVGVRTVDEIQSKRDNERRHYTQRRDVNVMIENSSVSLCMYWLLHCYVHMILPAVCATMQFTYMYQSGLFKCVQLFSFLFFYPSPIVCFSSQCEI